MKNFEEIGTEIGNLVEIKNAAYGDSAGKCEDYLRLLFPDGIPPDQYADAMLLARDFDKSMRIATSGPAALEENPWLDKAGYAIVGVHMHQKEASSPWPGSASVPNAPDSSSSAERDSADPFARRKTGACASARTVPEPLPQPDGYSELSPAPADAAIAMEAASPAAAVLPSQLNLTPTQLRILRWLPADRFVSWSALRKYTCLSQIDLALACRELSDLNFMMAARDCEFVRITSVGQLYISNLTESEGEHRPSQEALSRHLLRLMQRANEMSCCAWCGHLMTSACIRQTILGDSFLLCSPDCRGKRLEELR